MNAATTSGSHGDLCPCTPWTTTMLDNVIRRFLQNPSTMVGEYIRPGMTVMDIGCGPGFFTLAMAEMVGSEGKVIAIDVQSEMLDLVEQKSTMLNLSGRIRLHQSTSKQIGVGEQAEFILSFYMVHEVPDLDRFFAEIAGFLAPGGRYLVVEPTFHVPAAAFEQTLIRATKAGFRVEKRPNVFLSHAAVLVKEI